MSTMSNLPFVNIPLWVPDQVANWLRGLDEILEQYVPLFLDREVNGKQLLLLTHTDLRDMGIFKLGHRELILEAAEMLHSLYYELETTTVQSLALQLACKCRSLRSEVKAHLTTYLSLYIEAQATRVPLPILTAVSDVVATIKQLTSWFDRYPFESSDDYTDKRNILIGRGMELLDASQKDHPIECQKEIMEKCRLLAEFGDRIIQCSKDSLTIQPTSLEITTLRKKPEDDLGMHIQSLYNGTHIIGVINEQSPADLCGKVEEGDEVIQVNYQTVVGWNLTKLVAALKDNKKEVTLTLKKRPRHLNPFGPNPHRKKAPKNAKQSTFPKAFSRKSREDKSGRAPLKDFLNTMPVAFSKDSSQEPDSDNESEVFQTTTNAPCLLPLPLETAKQRRATVSGGSPPSGKRNSLEIGDLGNTPVRPKSYTISSPSSDVNSLLGSPGSDLMSPRFLDELMSARERSPTKEVSASLTDEATTGVSSPDYLESPDQSSTITASDISPVTMTTSIPIETSMTTLTLTPPNTSEASVIMEGASKSLMKQSVSDNNLKVNLQPSGHQELGMKRRKSSEGILALVSGEDKASPKLLRVTRIDSRRRNEMYEQERSRGQLSSVSGHSDLGESYTVNVVGGVVQKVPVNKDIQIRDSPSQSPSGLLRRKHFMKHMGSNRRISCKDLGGGDCQGWLYKKKEGAVISKWVKRWFVLKVKNLYFYKTQDDEKAQGVIHLATGFKVSPAPEIKRKFAFKASHDKGMTFYFASDRQEDMAKWMNKMGLAAIVYDTSQRQDRGSQALSVDSNQLYYSESDDEESHTSGRSTPVLPSTPHRGMSPVSGSPSSSREDLLGHEDDVLVREFTNIRRADIDLDGKNAKQKRASTLSKSWELDVEKSKFMEIELHRKKDSLLRTLRERERELHMINDLLNSDPVTSALLHAFREAHPDIIELKEEGLHGNKEFAGASDDDSISESDDL